MKLTDTCTGFQHVGLPTKDLEGTIKFYESLGFSVAGRYENEGTPVAFLRFGNLTIESWQDDDAVMRTGAINHVALDCTDVDACFEAAKAQGLRLKDQEVQSIPVFWDKGIRFFNIIGPNEETVEFCQIL